MELTDLVKNVWAVFFFGLLLTSGLLFIITFYNDLFFSLEWIKLIMLSSSIFMPFFIFNIVVAILFKHPASKQTSNTLLIWCSITTSFAIYCGIIFRYLMNIPLFWDILIILILSITLPKLFLYLTKEITK